MINCEKCNRVFRDIYNLNRHMTRSKQCSTNKITENTNSVDEKCIQLNPNNTLENPNCISDKKRCDFCLKTFFNSSNKIKHLKICKSKDDPIRKLEIEQSIKPIIPESKTECRYCNKVFSRSGLLNNHVLECEQREKYHKKLIRTSSDLPKSDFSINTQNNNCTIQNQQNNLILNFGKENLNHIETERIIGLLRDIRKEYGDNKVYLMAGNLIDSFDNYIREKPENRNIVIPNQKSIYGNVKTETGWKKMAVDRCLNTAFKSSAKELYKKKESIDSHNEKVFKSETNEQIFSEVQQFAKNGLTNSTNNDDLRQIKSSFKVGKLKEEIDF